MVKGSSRWLAATAGAVAVLILASITVVWLRQAGATRAYPADSPEGTVQRYAEAVAAGDVTLARSTFAAALLAACAPERLAQLFDTQSRFGGGWRMHIARTTTLSDGQVRVDVRLTRTQVSPPLGVYEYTTDQYFVAAREDGAWRLTWVGWPGTCR